MSMYSYFSKQAKKESMKMNFALFFLLMITSCFSPKVYSSDAPMHLDSFVSVNINATHTGRSLCIVPSCPDEIVNAIYMGSGVSVAKKSSKDTSLILTAGHVCENYFTVPEELRKRSLYVSSVRSISVTDYSGHEHSAAILVIDSVNDMCLLEVEGEIRPARIGSRPKTGDEVFNESAPLDISYPNAVPILGGFYCGSAEVYKDLNMSLYSVPGAPGSSGSPIFDSDGELIGILTKVVSTFDNISLGPNYDSMKEFIKAGKKSL